MTLSDQQKGERFQTALHMLKPLVLLLDITMTGLMISIWVLVPNVTGYEVLNFFYGAALLALFVFHLVLWPVLKPNFRRPEKTQKNTQKERV